MREDSHTSRTPCENDAFISQRVKVYDINENLPELDYNLDFNFMMSQEDSSRS